VLLAIVVDILLGFFFVACFALSSIPDKGCDESRNILRRHARITIAIFGVVVEEKAGIDCGYPNLWNCTLLNATTYGNFYVVPSLAISFIVLVSGL